MTKITFNEFAHDGAVAFLKEGGFATGLKVRAAAVRLCPVKYGQLKNSIMVKQVGKEDGFNDAGGDLAPSSHKLSVPVKTGETVVGTNSDHWYPEFGTRNQEAQPFLRPAVDRVNGTDMRTVAKEYGAKTMAAAFRKRGSRSVTR